MARKAKTSSIQALIFDTDVLIWYFRGNPKACRLFEKTPNENRWITSLTLMELFQGCRNKEELINTQALIAENFSRIIHPKTSISEKAIHLIENYSLSHGLRVIDALVASSALLTKAGLVSGNSKHFKFIPGLSFHSFHP